MSFKTVCSQCGSNSLYVTPEKNLTAYCFLCGYADFSGSDYRSIERFHDVKGLRQYYTEIAQYYHSCLDETSIRYLHSRGFTDYAISDLMLGFCPDDSHILYLDSFAKPSGLVNSRNNPFLANRIVFPYCVNDQVTDIRGRSLEKQTEYRYLSPKGSSYYRGADYPYLYNGSAQLIVEGEIKAWFAREAGYTVHGLPGINSMRPKTDGAVVCFDSSTRPKSRAAVFRAVLSLSKRIPGIRVAQLPIDRSESDIGIDDFILRYGADEFRKIVDHALPVDVWKRIHVV